MTKPIVLVKLDWYDAARLAEGFIRKHLQGKVVRHEIVGELRRQKRVINGHISIVCVPTDWNAFDYMDKLPQAIKAGPRHKEFVYELVNMRRTDGTGTITGTFKLELFITTLSDYGRIVALRTGDVKFSSAIITSAWRRKKYVGTEFGLAKEAHCEKQGGVWRVKPEYADISELEKPYFDSEQSFFEWLGIKYILPLNRNTDEWTKPSKKAGTTDSGRVKKKSPAKQRTTKATGVRRRAVHGLHKVSTGDPAMESRSGGSSVEVSGQPKGTRPKRKRQ